MVVCYAACEALDGSSAELTNNREVEIAIAEVRVLQSEVQELFHIVQRLVTVSKKRCNRFDIFRYYGIISFKPDTPKRRSS